MKHATHSSTKRRFLAGIAALPVISLFAPAAWALNPTPSAMEGPFYPSPGMRFRDADNDLVMIAGHQQAARGEIVVLMGRILDANEQPVDNARVEIWQCDANGHYIHTADTHVAPDPNFQGFGHVVTGPDGQFAFRTIKPVAYPGRTPHIHVKVFAVGRELTTQLYTKNEPRNARDRIFNAMTASQKDAVLMDFGAGPEGPTAVLDIVI